MEYCIYPRLVSTTSFGNVLDPSKLYTINLYQLLYNAARQLVTLGKDGTYHHSSLLSEFHVLKDNRGIRGVLATDAKYSDGSAILARDVLKTFQRLILNGSAHSTPKEMILSADSVSNMEDMCPGLVEIDQRTFEVHFTAPVNEIKYFLQLADFSILHPKQYLKEGPLTFEDWSVTSGHYFLITQASGDLLFQANPFYSQEGQIPKILVKAIPNEQTFIEGIVNKEYHLGTINFKHYRRLRELNEEFEKYELFADRNAWVVGLVLNTRSKFFQDPSVRRWIYKRIFEQLNSPKDSSEISKKASQFYLPHVPGRLSEEDTQKQVASFVTTEEPPEILKSGIRMRAAQNLANLFPLEIVDELNRILAPVKFEYADDVEHKDYARFKKERDFDAAMIVTSMSYKEPTESLNLAYTSDAPTLTDPTGRIHSLLTKVHSTLNEAKKREFTRQILLQMIFDAEFVPLLYIDSFHFAHKDFIDASSVHFGESAQFHSFKLK